MTEITVMFETLLREIEIIKTYLAKAPEEPDSFDKVWIDGQDVMLSLHISKRTLQSLRDTGLLPYSRIQGKFYYKKSDIENLLVKNYRSTPFNLKNNGTY
ncbi:MAG: helix-turn-helix domain-containing protein [Cytophagaceae bacterium]|nr:helix-turn-helix domain-containing protein [Cytophagaceae bacterium]MBL0300566.1 helix-turn-helix domain-containing protein [Cytophagaceae bacterium]